VFRIRGVRRAVLSRSEDFEHDRLYGTVQTVDPFRLPGETPGAAR